MKDEQYKVENYSDQELYTILELSSPTDGELEARIIQMIQRHKQVQSSSGQKMYQFFIDIYERFFGEEDQSSPPSKPSKPPKPSKTSESLPPPPSLPPPSLPPPSLPPPSLPPPPPPTDSEINLIQEQKYTKGKLNPLLKETYQRTISIDSQYRDVEYISSTDFILHFSEVLKDVVSLKLYAVQIPVTWYTISESYEVIFSS